MILYQKSYDKLASKSLRIFFEEVYLPRDLDTESVLGTGASLKALDTAHSIA